MGKRSTRSTGRRVFRRKLSGLDSPLLDPESPLKLWLNRVDYGLTVCFIGESAAKIVAHGLLCEARGAYLKDPWNVADAVVVVASVARGRDSGHDDTQRLRRPEQFVGRCERPRVPGVVRDQRKVPSRVFWGWREFGCELCCAQRARLRREFDKIQAVRLLTCYLVGDSPVLHVRSVTSCRSTTITDVSRSKMHECRSADCTTSCF